MTPEEVSAFWAQAGETRWFIKDAAFDGALRVRFGKALVQARDGAFDHWADTAEGALGLVILLDQMSRNIHRGSALAFAADARALRIARKSIAKGFHNRLAAPRAQWLILPFEHAEDLDCQRRAVALLNTMGLPSWPIGHRSTSTSSPVLAVFPIGTRFWGAFRRPLNWPF